jgi:hypothetical protein
MNQAMGSLNTSAAAGSDPLRWGFTANSGLLRIESMCRVAEAYEDVARAGEGLRCALLTEDLLARLFVLLSGEERGCSRSRWARKELVRRLSSCWLSRGERGSCGWILDARVLSMRLLAADCMAAVAAALLLGGGGAIN